MMVFNPLFLQNTADSDRIIISKPGKIENANYLFSDLIKVYLNDGNSSQDGIPAELSELGKLCLNKNNPLQVTGQGKFNLTLPKSLNQESPILKLEDFLPPEIADMLKDIKLEEIVGNKLFLKNQDLSLDKLINILQNITKTIKSGTTPEAVEKKMEILSKISSDGEVTDESVKKIFEENDVLFLKFEIGEALLNLLFQNDKELIKKLKNPNLDILKSQLNGNPSSLKQDQFNVSLEFQTHKTGHEKISEIIKAGSKSFRQSDLGEALKLSKNQIGKNRLFETSELNSHKISQEKPSLEILTLKKVVPNVNKSIVSESGLGVKDGKIAKLSKTELVSNKNMLGRADFVKLNDLNHLRRPHQEVENETSSIKTKTPSLKEFNKLFSTGEEKGPKLFNIGKVHNSDEVNKVAETKGIKNTNVDSPKIPGGISESKGLKVLQFQNPSDSSFEKVVKENIQNAKVYDIRKGTGLTPLKNEGTPINEILNSSKNEAGSKTENLTSNKDVLSPKIENLTSSLKEVSPKTENLTSSLKDVSSKINEITFTKNNPSSKADISSSAKDVRIFSQTTKTDSYTLKDMVNNNDFASSPTEEKIIKGNLTGIPVEKEVTLKDFSHIISDPKKDLNPAKETIKKSPDLKLVDFNNQKPQAEKTVTQETDKVPASNESKDLKSDAKELFEREIKTIRRSPVTKKNEFAADKELLKMTGEKRETIESRNSDPRVSQNRENIPAPKVELNDSNVREIIENSKVKETITAREIEQNPKEILLDKTQDRYRVHREAGEKTDNSKPAETETKSQQNYSSDQDKSSHKEHAQKEQSRPGEFNEAVNNIKTTPFDKTEKSEFETLMNESSRIVKKGEIFKEISKFIVSQEKQSLTFRIEPEQLGRLKITLDMVEHAIKANIEVESEVIKTFLEKNISDLFNHLSKEGIQLNSVNISLTEKDNKQAKQSSSKKKNEESESKEEKVDDSRDGKIKMMGYNTRDYLV